MTRLLRPLAILFCLALLPLAAPPAAAENAATEHVKTLGTRAIQALTGQMPRPERESRFRALLQEGFAVDRIGRFVLGRYWRQASPEEQREYLGLFEKFIVQAYAARFAEYSGEQFRVTGSRKDGDDTLVTSEIFKPSGSQPTRVEWRVATGDGGARVTDVIVEGVSMAVTQRSEFAAVIQRNGGRISGLLDALRQKTG